MSSKLSAGVGGRGTHAVVEHKKPGKGDYELHRIEIENGDNGGATVRLHHRLKRDVEDSMRKKGHEPMYEHRHMETTHPFEKRGKALRFAKSQLHEVESSEGKGDEDADDGY